MTQLRALALTLPLILIAILACSVREGAASEPPARPNVVFILADDLGFMDVGCNNPATFYETPHIDRLAAGMRFTAGYASCPVCSPSRASIMTGKYPPRTGITDFIGGNRAGRLRPAPNQNHLALEEVTLAEALRAAGYATFFAGKWHLGTGPHAPTAQGFGPELTGTGQFYYPPDDSPPDSKDDPKTTDRIARAAVRFIADHRDRPFFAYLPFLAVHIPFAGTTWSKSIAARKPRHPPMPGERSASPVFAWCKIRKFMRRCWSSSIRPSGTCSPSSTGPAWPIGRSSSSRPTTAAWPRPRAIPRPINRSAPARAGLTRGNPRAVDHRGPRRYETRQRVCHPGCQHRLLPDHS